MDSIDKCSKRKTESVTLHWTHCLPDYWFHSLKSLEKDRLSINAWRVENSQLCLYFANQKFKIIACRQTNFHFALKSQLETLRLRCCIMQWALWVFWNICIQPTQCHSLIRNSIRTKLKICHLWALQHFSDFPVTDYQKQSTDSYFQWF